MIQRSVVAGVLAVMLGLVAVVGCTEEQRRDIEGAAIANQLEDTTGDVMGDLDVEVESLDCSADIADDSTVTGSCSGSTEDEQVITTSLTGTVDVDEAECDSTLVITLGGETVVDQAGFECIDGSDVEVG